MSNYFISSNDRSIEIWGTALLPFEPTGWLKDLRTEIQNKIKQLKPTNFLYSKLTSSKRDKVDLDNVLFYNVAYSTFSNLSLDSIIMERSYQKPKPTPDGKNYDYYLYYTVEKVESEHKRKKVLGTFSNLPIDNFDSQTKVDRIWYSIKKGSITHFKKNHTTEFGVNISITSSNLRLVSEVGMKRIIDASIASFQSHLGDEPEMFKRLAQNLSINQNDAKYLLCDESHAVLGSSSLLTSHRDGIKWNPNDDLAVFISLALNSNQKSLDVSGEIFSVS
ncbi:hypothetical protein [Nitrosarchaeum sp.]|uniref:hypothetical protein n=1 Tax=Nitrosarchaeum sp. TaxID=2026886 RepID=UPI00247CAD0A|nr:hypothetical protein [Nitrosarchaeum sp.]MCV0412394.1 hypothetical protein [Nitrosarchaeum sp.]